MERRLKERLIGAAVLVMLAVIFIPMILDNSVDTDTAIRGTNIPSRPDTEFSSRIVPLEESDLALEQVPDEIETIKQEVTVVLDKTAEPAVEPVTAPVVDKVEVSEQVPPKAKAEPESMGVTAWVVQLGSFSSEANARALNEKLRKSGYPSFVEPLRQESGAMVFRVRVGPELLRSDAQALKEKLDGILQAEKIKGIVVRYP